MSSLHCSPKTPWCDLWADVGMLIQFDYLNYNYKHGMPSCRGKFKLFHGIRWINSTKVTLFAESVMPWSPTVPDFSSQWIHENLVWSIPRRIVTPATRKFDVCRRALSVLGIDLYTILRRVHDFSWRQKTWTKMRTGGRLTAVAVRAVAEGRAEPVLAREKSMYLQIYCAVQNISLHLNKLKTVLPSLDNLSQALITNTGILSPC